MILKYTLCSAFLNYKLKEQLCSRSSSHTSCKHLIFLFRLLEVLLSHFLYCECLPFTEKIRKFRLECKWKGYFGLPERKISEMKGTSSEVVQNSQPEYPNGKCTFHLLFLLVPGLSACIRPRGDVRGNGTRTSHGNFHSGFSSVPFIATFDQPVFPTKW